MIVITTTLICDVCLKEIEASSDNSMEKDLREIATREGWLVSVEMADGKSEDYCQACQLRSLKKESVLTSKDVPIVKDDFS